MKKKRIIGDLIVAIALVFIFRVASHTWYGGAIVGICYFLASTLIQNIQSKIR